MTKSRHILVPRKFWSDADRALLQSRYPHESTARLAAALGRTIKTVYAMASSLGLHKSPAFLATPMSGRLRPGVKQGGATRFQPGHVTWNKGLRRPGWGPGRMKESQFKKGSWPSNKDPEFYVIGALRVNSEGYIAMRTSFKPGSGGWTSLARTLWEDAFGPVPKGHTLIFKDGDRLNVELGNLELISRADLMRRNSVHNIPEPLKSTIQVLGQLKRRISERERRQEGSV